MTSLVLAAAACMPAVAAAQPAANPQTPQPDDWRVPVPALVYESAFARYRPLFESAVSSWKSVNDEVGRIGGWKVYARESYETTAPVAAGGTSPTAPPPPVTPAQTR
jgi:hypothetical protein